MRHEVFSASHNSAFASKARNLNQVNFLIGFEYGSESPQLKISHDIEDLFPYEYSLLYLSF